ncbi:MAG: dihydroorotase [Flavobacteriales bacterium]|nr:dihydroorotase [Flavobacteriales bacterium]HRO39635.1 dihydroorotase [Flavobacteriales bacterium]HRP82054.1 dihydroorotase [Flavobacteriales bacterium]
MNDLLFRQVAITDPGGPLHDTVADLHFSEGRLLRAGAKLPKGDAEVIAVEGLHASPGWVDLRAHFCDPGEEYKEDVRSGLDAAAAGGYTAVAVLPGTSPPVDQRATVEYLLRKSQGHAVRLLPLGTLTKGGKGEQLAELYDMQQAGAVGFTDDLHPVRNARLMLLALQYAHNFNGLVMAMPQDPDLMRDGQMHEGVMSTRLGLRGMPAMAEPVRLARDLQLLEYTGSRLHVEAVSTAEGVALIREAKARKLRVTASVCAHHLLLDDGVLRGFDSHYKVMPPFRSPEHIEALREGVKDGTIDSIVSDHRPEDVEHKKLEFGHAAFGIIGLETAYAVANTALQGRMTGRRIVERFCHGPRAVLGLPVPHIAEGEMAELTLFAPAHQWQFSNSDIVSRSHNTPFLGHRFTGKAMGIVANGQMRWGHGS